MNAPVTTAGTGVRPAAPRASDAGRSHSAAPFAHALDGAVSEVRSSSDRASERGVERRGMRDDRAAEHAAAKDQRVEDRARAATGRALDAADRTGRAADRASDRATGEAPLDTTDTTSPRTAGPDETAREKAAPTTPDQGTDAAGTSAEAPRGGLPALWALMMGAPLAGAPSEGADAGPALPAAVPGMPTTGATAGADAGRPLAAGSLVSTDPLVDIRPTGSAGPVVGAAPGADPATVVASAATKAATADPTATESGLPASFPTVIAAAGAVVTEPAAPAAPAVPTGAPAPAAPALPTGAPAPAAPAVSTGAPAPAAPVIAVQAATAAVTAADSGEPAVATPSVAPTADTDGASQPSTSSTPAATGTTGPPSVGAAGPAPAAPDVDGASGSGPAPPVGSQVARQVAVLRGGPDGAHAMTLVLTPETLGPVEVQVTVTKGSVELALRGAHEQGRAALLDGLPDLRRDLEAAGLSCTRLEVDRETGGSSLERQPAQQQASGERSGRHDRGDDRSRPWGRTADSGGSGTSAPQNRSTSSGVDVLA